MKIRFSKAIVSGLALFFAICVAASANAGVIYAGHCGHVPAYTTIQQAVSNSVAGGTVKVCPGIYPEQVTISQNLTLQGITAGTANQAVITEPVGGFVANTNDLVSPSGPDTIAAQILVQTATIVNISDIVVDGSGWDGCSTNLVGIYYQNASGTVNRAVARNQTAVPISGCQAGTGIYAEGLSPGTATVTVENSSVHDFQKNGITANEAGTTLTAAYNDVRGQGSTAANAQNGIQFGFGATGTASSNTVTDVVYSPCVSQANCSWSATGILVYDSPNVTISANRVTNTQGGIYVYGDGATGPYGGSADNPTITLNVVNGSLVWDGIDVCGSMNGKVNSNTVVASGQSGIHLDGECAPQPSGGITANLNTINEACAGILNGATSSPNSVGTTGYYNVEGTLLSADSATCTPPGVNGEASPAKAAGSRIRPATALP